MAAEETKHDLFLKRAQVTVAILAGVATLILGVYNVKKTVFSEKGPGTLLLTVRSDKGPAVAGARVELFTAENALVTADETSRDGKFTQNDLEAGSYQAKLTRVGFEPLIVTVRVKPKKTSEIEIILRAAAQSAASSDPIQSAFQEVGASWIKKLGKTDAGELAKQDAS